MGGLCGSRLRLRRARHRGHSQLLRKVRLVCRDLMLVYAGSPVIGTPSVAVNIASSCMDVDVFQLTIVMSCRVNDTRVFVYCAIISTATIIVVIIARPARSSRHVKLVLIILGRIS